MLLKTLNICFLVILRKKNNKSKKFVALISKSGLVCKNNGASTTLTASARKIIIDMHNKYRSLLARGKATANNGTMMAGPAKNMYKMVKSQNFLAK